MPSPESACWRDLFQSIPDVDPALLHWWLSDRLDASLTSLPLGECPTPGDLRAFEQAVDRLRAGEPVQYVCGRVPFRNLTLNVTPDVLIPRPETEQLVQLALERVLQPGDRVLDVGTGSGCIALSVKQERPDLHVEATDVSDAALAVARENASSQDLDVTFRQADLLAEEKERSWDVILSNPPYIGESEQADLPEVVRNFEPENALFSGPEGLDHIRCLLQQAKMVLKPGGRMLLETGETQGPAIRRYAEELGYSLESFTDLAGRERFRLLRISESRL